jgi:hypothetical protein
MEPLGSGFQISQKIDLGAFSGVFEDEAYPFLANKYESCDECDSFLCDECTADIDGETLWVCEECDWEFGLCTNCYNEKEHGHEHDDFVEVPNIFDLRNYCIFSTKKTYVARGNKTIALIGKHPLTVSAAIEKEIIEETTEGLLFSSPSS